MLSLSKRIFPITRCAFRPSTRARFESTAVSGKERHRVRHRLTIPISVAGNDKIEKLINLLNAKATNIGVTSDMIYGGRPEDMSFKVSPVVIQDPNVPGQYAVTVEHVQTMLNELQPSIQEIRGGATGPLRIPLGKLTTLNSTIDPGKTVIVSVKPLPGPEADTLRTILELISKRLYETRITPTYALWALRNPTLNAERIASIFLVNGLEKGTDKSRQRTFDSKPILAMEELKQWGFKRSEYFSKIDLGEIHLPGVQLWKGATILGGRRIMEAEIKF